MLFEVQHKIIKTITPEHSGYYCTMLHGEAPTNVVPLNWKYRKIILIIQSGL